MSRATRDSALEHAGSATGAPCWRFGVGAPEQAVHRAADLIGVAIVSAANGRVRAFARAHPWISIGVLVAALLVVTGVAGFAYVEREDIPREARRLVEELGLERAVGIADVGAGSGRLSVALWSELRARGASPKMWATELDRERLSALERAVAGAGAPVTVLRGAEAGTALPDGCCDAIVMRTVYHHVADPAAMNASLLRSLRPGGRLTIIEFAPVGPLRWMHPEGASPARRGHGVARDDLERELGAAGFRLVKELPDWHPLMYALVFVRRAERTARIEPAG